MSEEEEQNAECQSLTEEEQAFQSWAQSLMYVAMVGKPFLNERGEFQLNILDQDANENVTVFVSRKPNNIIEFPKKKELPKRI